MTGCGWAQSWFNTCRPDDVLFKSFIFIYSSIVWSRLQSTSLCYPGSFAGDMTGRFAPVRQRSSGRRINSKQPNQSCHTAFSFVKSSDIFAIASNSREISCKCRTGGEPAKERRAVSLNPSIRQLLTEEFALAFYCLLH